MASKTSFAAVAFAAALSVASATTLTLNDYPKFADGSAKYNPPTCGVPYDSLDLNRITAWSSITGEQDSKCGSCAKVCGDVGCEYLLIVDQCTLEADHLDISTGAGNNIVGSDTGNWVVTMELVDVKNCAGIWDGRMFFSWDQPNANFQQLKQYDSGSSSTPSPAVFAPAPSPTAGYAATSSSAPAQQPYYSAAVSSSEAAETPYSASSTVVPYSYSAVASYTSSAAAESTTCTTSTASPASSASYETPASYQSPPSYTASTVSTVYGTGSGSSPYTAAPYPTASSNATTPVVSATPPAYTGASSRNSPVMTTVTLSLFGLVLSLVF